MLWSQKEKRTTGLDQLQYSEYYNSSYLTLWIAFNTPINLWAYNWLINLSEWQMWKMDLKMFITYTRYNRHNSITRVRLWIKCDILSLLMTGSRVLYAFMYPALNPSRDTRSSGGLENLRKKNCVFKNACHAMEKSSFLFQLKCSWAKIAIGNLSRVLPRELQMLIYVYGPSLKQPVTPKTPNNQTNGEEYAPFHSPELPQKLSIRNKLALVMLWNVFSMHCCLDLDHKALQTSSAKILQKAQYSCNTILFALLQMSLMTSL